MIIFLITCGFAVLFSFVQLNNVSAYGMDTSLSEVDASLIITDEDNLYRYISCIGDTNGDGYDDILICARNFSINDEHSEIYLIFGQSKGWYKNMNIISYINASFLIKDKNEASNSSFLPISGAGDVNGDGYDDFLIGNSHSNGSGIVNGQAFLFFGKSSGWAKNTYLSNADVSFEGVPYDYAGDSISSAGDVNGDGFDDILIGASRSNISTGKTYLVLGKKSGWLKNISLSNADGSFIGEDMHDYSGHCVSSAGDVNCDGYDDILIGAYGNGVGSTCPGKVYLIFGKPSGWLLNTPLSNADASFCGKINGDKLGHSVSCVGDVNKDNYDDFIITSGKSLNGSYYDNIYLIFGKEKGWVKDFNLINFEDASFVVENINDIRKIWGDTSYLSGAGDTNGDGYDDFLIGACLNSETESFAGQSYLILGNSIGWKINTSLAEANSSFIGEDLEDYSGESVSGGGDINGDGYDDILIVSNHKAYIIFPERNIKPSSIESIKLYDNTFTSEIEQVDIRGNVYVEMIGTDGDSLHRNVAEVKIKSSITDNRGIILRLRETGSNTGVYRSNFKVMNLSHESHSWIGATNGEVITVSSLRNPNVFDALTVEIKDFKIIPVNDKIEIFEDNYFEQKFDHIGAYEPVTWSYESNASWLNWNSDNHSIYGIPTNDDVGKYWVKIKASDNSGDSDKQNFTLIVHNVNDPPTISDAPKNATVIQPEPQKLDFSSYIYDIDNPKSDLTLQTSSEYVQTEGFELIFDYRYSDLWYENVTVNVTDGDLVSKNHYIEVEILVVDAWIVEIEDYSPKGNNVSIFSNISITFNRLMNQTSCERAFSITPLLEGEFDWDYNILTFNPITPLDFNTTYIVTVATTATSVEGHSLNTQTHWNFTTETSTGPDRDNDGYPDEFDAFPDDPNYYLDTDRDGMPDAWEEEHGLDKSNPNDAAADPDNDGIPNKDEFDDGTDPLLSDIKKRHEDNYTIFILIVLISILIILFVLIILKPKLSKKK